MEDRTKGPIEKWKLLFLFIAAGIIAAGLVMSYSRGAWSGAAIGILYLTNKHRKFKWWYALPLTAVVAATVWFFWNTPRMAPWYSQRLDLSRGSVQHRLAAWKAGLEIMRDHPFGVGWNNTVDVYQKNYSPPTDAAAAINTNDYLMLGTQLGILALLCFLAYVYSSFRTRTADPIQIACRAGAVSLLVAFWFDGGLFALPTAAVFWVLLELGTANTHPAKA